ncbi:unnamed protein product [Parajaminaea phylloscopi]
MDLDRSEQTGGQGFQGPEPSPALDGMPSKPRTKQTPRGPKKADPYKPPFEGCCIAISGSLKAGVTQAQVFEDIIEAGGTQATYIEDTTTHLVVPNKPLQVSAKVKEAQEAGIHIVTYQWVVDCLSLDKRQPESSYLAVQEEDESDSDASDTKAPRAKRARASVTDDADGPSGRQRPKRAKTSNSGNGSSKKAPSIQEISDSSEDEDEDQDDPAPKMKKATIKGRAPVDERSGLVDTHHVLEHQGVLYDCMLNQVDIGKNSNKFYVIQVLQGDKTHSDLRLFTKWGRVGESGMTQIRSLSGLSDAAHSFASQFKKKTGVDWVDRETAQGKPGKYIWLERDYEQYAADEAADEADSQDDSDGNNGGSATRHKSKSPTKKAASVADKATRPDKVPTKLHPAVHSLGELIFSEKLFSDVLAEMEYDASKMPLGKLSMNSIERGYSKLTEIDTLLGQTSGIDAHDELATLTSQYYTLIPHAFSRSYVPPVINTRAMVQRETLLIDNLRQMSAGMRLIHKDQGGKAARVVNPIDASIANLGLDKIEPVDKDSNEYKYLEKYCYKTKGETHTFNFKVLDIFRVERAGDDERFCPFKTIQPDNRQLLWHGSRTTNFAGILSQGLRIAPPEAPATGTMFGKGIYLADMSSKSIQYCNAYATQNQALLLLAEAQLGSELLLSTADYNADQLAKQQKKHSTHGLGRTGFPDSQWRDAGQRLERPELQNVKMPSGSPVKTSSNYGLFYHEKIVYKEAQVRFRYLFRLDVS